VQSSGAAPKRRAELRAVSGSVLGAASSMAELRHKFVIVGTAIAWLTFLCCALRTGAHDITNWAQLQTCRAKIQVVYYVALRRQMTRTPFHTILNIISLCISPRKAEGHTTCKPCHFQKPNFPNQNPISHLNPPQVSPSPTSAPPNITTNSQLRRTTYSYDSSEQPTQNVFRLRQEEGLRATRLRTTRPPGHHVTTRSRHGGGSTGRTHGRSLRDDGWPSQARRGNGRYDGWRRESRRYGRGGCDGWALRRATCGC